MSYKSEPGKPLTASEKYSLHLARLKEKSAEVPVQTAQAPRPEQIKIESCDGDTGDLCQQLGNLGAAFDKSAEMDLRALIEARGRKKKFGGSGYRW